MMNIDMNAVYCICPLGVFVFLYSHSSTCILSLGSSKYGCDIINHTVYGQRSFAKFTSNDLVIPSGTFVFVSVTGLLIAFISSQA